MTGLAHYRDLSGTLDRAPDHQDDRRKLDHGLRKPRLQKFFQLADVEFAHGPNLALAGSALVDEVLDVIEDCDRIGAPGHRSGRSRATYVFDPAILYTGMHRFAVHDGVRREAWFTHRRNDNDAFASIEVFEIAEVTDIGVVCAIAHHHEGVQVILRHVAAQALDALMILRDLERKIHPGQTILECIRHAPPAIRHLWTITCPHMLSPCCMAPRRHCLRFAASHIKTASTTTLTSREMAVNLHPKTCRARDIVQRRR